MPIEDVLKVVGGILVSLGGGGAIVLAMSGWLGKVWADRLMEKEKAKFSRDLEAFKHDLEARVETHKIRLKKSEFIFQKEFEAASELVAYIQRLNPPYRHPMMEWGDACEEIGEKLEDIERDLNDFVSRHGAILSDDARGHLGSAIALAGENKFDDPSTGKSPSEAARELVEHLEQASENLTAAVHAQATV